MSELQAMMIPKNLRDKEMLQIKLFATLFHFIAIIFEDKIITFFF